MTRTSGAKMADSKRTISIRMALEDQDFKTKIKSLSSDMNVLKSDMARVESQFIGQQNSLSALTAKYAIYEKELANLNTRIKTYSDQNDKLRAALDELNKVREQNNKSTEIYTERLKTNEVALKTYLQIQKSQEELFKQAKEKYDQAKDALKAFEDQYNGTTKNFPWYKKKHEELTKAVEETKKEHDYYATVLKNANQNVKEATARGEEYGKTLKDLKDDATSLDNQERDLNNQINANTAAMNRAQAEANKDATAMAQLKEGIDDCKKTGKDATDMFDRFTGQMVRTNEATKALAEAMALELVKKGFNVAKEAVLESIDAFKEYEQALAGVSKTTGMEWGGDDIKALGDDFKALSQTMPVSAKELLNVAQIAGQLGIQGSEDIQKFTKTMAQLSVSTNLSAEEAATALAQMAAVTGMAASDYDKLGSAVVSLGNKFPVAEDTIVRIAQRFSGAAVNANLAESSIVAMAAAAGSVGIQAESAGTSLTKLVQKMGDAVESGDDLETWARVANMSAEDFARLWGKDATQAIARFLGGFGKLGPQASATFKELGIGEARLQDLVRRLSNAEYSTGLFTRALEEANDAFKEGVALENEANVAYDTLNSRLQILNNSVDVLGIEVGSVLAPQVETAVGLGTTAVQIVSGLIQDFPGVVYGLEGITAVIGTMAAVALPKAIPMVGEFVNQFKALAGIMKLQWGNMFSVLSEGLAAFATASIGAQIAIGGVVAALVLLAIGIAKYSEEGDVATKKAEDVSEAFQTQEEVAKALAEAENKLAEIKKKYKREEEECGQVTQDTSDALDEQQLIVDKLKELFDELGIEVDDATGSENEFASATSEADEKVKELTGAFEENIQKVSDFSTKYKATAADYITEIQQQIEWNNKYADNRDSLLSRDIDGLAEWVASWDDGTAEAAKKMNAFANASDKDIKAMIALFSSLSNAQKRNADSAESNYKTAYDAYEKMAKKVEDVRARNAAAFAAMEGDVKVRIQAIQTSINGLKDKTVYVRVQQIGSPLVGNGRYLSVNAQGLDYVPYDGFVSMLHEGEKVLNRAEASAYRKLERTTNNNTTNNSNITLNVYGTKGQSADEISNIVMRKIQNATNRKQAVWA